MQPRRLSPTFVEKEAWGSRRLEPWFRDRGAKIGEVWFDADPLLVKFIFTTDKLSVQVHPPDDYARRHHNSRGKTEMWHVLAAEPGAKIAAGFREPISRERLRSAAISGQIESLLEWHEARPGDTFFIPAGTVHAIGAGLTLCEIQQHSDITYRLYDYGRPRELHLDHAVAVSHLGRHTARQKARGGVLVACDHFTTSRVEVGSAIRYEPRGADDVLIVIEGAGEIAGEPTGAGDVWSVPAAGAPFEIRGKLALLTSQKK